MIRAGQLRAYAALHTPENNTTLTGGAVDLSTSIDFSDLLAVDGLQIVSSEADSISVQIFGRLGSGMISSEIVALNGRTPVPTVQVAWERIMKVLKGASSSGDIAVEQLTAVLSGTLQGGSADRVILSVAASATDNAYNGLVFRLTAGTGVGTIAKVLDYDGTTRTAVLDKLVTVDGASQYRLSPGVVISRLPHEIMAVRRPFYNLTAAPPSGVDRVYYEKFFWRNDSLEVLQAPEIKELANPSGKVTFGLELGNASVANRLTAPLIPNMTFGRLPQALPSASPDLASGQAVGVWLSMSVQAGQSPIRSSYQSGISGQTV